MFGPLAASRCQVCGYWRPNFFFLSVTERAAEFSLHTDPAILPAVITVRDLTRRFGSVHALDSISFEIDKGEVVGFLGPNGAGKTTTMRILAGYLPATSGVAAVAGFDVLLQSMEVRKRIGYLPESVPLYLEHRVEEMMLFQARLHRMPRKEAKRRIPEVLDRVGILDRSRQMVGHLSRGLRQRAGLAVALLPNPEVLILDEPTSGLDPMQRIAVRELIGELAEEHTVLLSSHILPEIEAVCPRVIIINKGKIAADGSPEQLVQELGGGSCVRMEAVVMGEGAADEAARLLKALPGASEVRALGRLGIHEQFEIVCDEDLREDVGALAAHKGWALRELSFQRPKLEELFARIALDLDEAPIKRAAAPAQEMVPATIEKPATVNMLSPFENAPPKAATEKPKQVYNLNPFDQGASRDLTKPKSVDSNDEEN